MANISLLSVLQKTISPDQHELEVAQHFLEEASRSNLPRLLTELSDILADVKNDPVVRMQAGLQLKNALYSKDEAINKAYQARWLQFPNEEREHIKRNCISTLGTEVSGRSSAAQCVAYIACAEIPVNQWPELIVSLCQNVLRQDAGESLRHASLEAMGYICQDIVPEILVAQSNEILTAIICGMKKEEPSDNVRLAATTALLNSLEFTKHNFDIESERNYIMTVVCESTQSLNSQIRVAALQCLVKIMSLYYCHMEMYMGQALFAITYDAMNSNIPEIALQGIEFWSSVCDEELDLALEATECSSKGIPPAVSSKFYAKGALEHIAPILMKIMAQQDEGADDDDWNPSKAAGVCLVLLAQCCEDSIVPLVIPFVNDNIKHENWRMRDAAIMAFGSILEGPNTDALKPLVESAMPFIIELLRDPVSAVRDSAAWTIGRVCDLLPEVALAEVHLVPLLSGLFEGLTAEPRVAANVCWAFKSLADGAYDVAVNEHAETSNDVEEEPTTYALSRCFDTISLQLLEASNRADGAQHSLRNAAYSALMALIRSAARDCYAHVQGVTLIVLERLETILGFESQIIDSMDRSQFNDLQSLLCATLQSVLKKISKDDAPRISDKVMSALMSMFHSVVGTQEPGKSLAKTDGVVEDALLAVSALIDVIGELFLKYLDAFMPVLVACLRLCEETQVCLNAVGLLGDMCRTLGRHMSPRSEGLFAILMETLQDATADKSIRPAILSTFGDLALALGPDIRPFLCLILETLRQATQAEVNLSDPDMVDYLNSLRISCLEAYTGILQCSKYSGNEITTELEIISADVPSILSFIQQVGLDEITNEELLSSCCGVIGDLLSCYGTTFIDLIETEAISTVLNRGRRCKLSKHKQLAIWAIREIKRLKNVQSSEAHQAQSSGRVQTAPTVSASTEHTVVASSGMHGKQW